MIYAGLLRAVRDAVRTACTLGPGECEVQMNGRPAVTMGQKYVSVHPTSFGPGDVDVDYGVSIALGVSCTLTMRSSAFQVAKHGTEVFLSQLHGMEPIIWQIIMAVHRKFGVITAANTSQTYTINESLKLTSVELPPSPQGPEWFTSDQRSDYDGRAPMGYSCEIQFSGAQVNICYDT